MRFMVLYNIKDQVKIQDQKNCNNNHFGRNDDILDKNTKLDESHTMTIGTRSLSLEYQSSRTKSSLWEVFKKCPMRLFR